MFIHNARPAFRLTMMIVATLTSAAVATAQTVEVVVPASATSTDGNRWMSSFFREAYGRRVQVIIDASQLSGLQGKRIYELAFRKDVRTAHRYGVLRGGETTKLRLTASLSDADPAKPSLVYGQNHGTPSLVFSGVVSLPTVSAQDVRAVATFDAAEAPTVTFQRPIQYIAGKALILDFVTEGVVHGYRWSWPVDSATVHRPGTVQVLGRSCWTSRIGDAATVVKGSLRPGMHIKTDSATPPDPIASFVLFGLSRDLALGSIPLPIKIAEPDCQLFVSPDIIVPSLFYPGESDRDDGFAGAELATPHLASLFGSKLFIQHLFLHRENSVLRLKTSNGIEAGFTKFVPSLGASLVASIDPNAASGRVFLDFVPVLALRAK